MRYRVRFRKPKPGGASYRLTNRLFDIPKGADQEAIERAAQMVAGPTAKIVSIQVNNPKEDIHGA